MAGGPRFGKEPESQNKKAAIDISKLTKKYSLVFSQDEKSSKIEFTLPSDIAEEKSWLEFVSDLKLNPMCLLLGTPSWFPKPGLSFELDSNKLIKEMEIVLEDKEAAVMSIINPSQDSAVVTDAYQASAVFQRLFTEMLHDKFDKLDKKFSEIDQKLDDICDQVKEQDRSMVSIMDAIKASGLSISEVEWKLVKIEIAEIAKELGLPESHRNVAMTYYQREEERSRDSVRKPTFPDLDFGENPKSEEN